MASYDNIHSSKSIVSTNNLNPKLGGAIGQYCFGKLDSNGQLVVSTAPGDNAVGVIQDRPNAGDPSFICGPGDVTKVLCGGTFVAGAFIASDSQGRAIVAVSGDYILGEALSAGALNTTAEILFQPRGSHL